MYKLFINGVQIGNYRTVKQLTNSVHGYAENAGFTERRLNPDTVRWDGKVCRIDTYDRYK